MLPPESTADLLCPTLWHPDLYLNNVFVDPDTKKITQIIDWQLSAALPLYYQGGVPKMVKHKGPVSSDMQDIPHRQENHKDPDRDQ